MATNAQVSAGQVRVRTDARVEVFPDNLRRTLANPNGKVGQNTRHTAQVLLQTARSRIGDRYSGTTGKVTDGRHGHLKDSGQVRPTGDATYVVTFHHPIAFIHHNGASPHSYSETKWYANPHAGSSSKGSKPFRKRGPFGHPGHKGNPYLIDAAQQLGLKLSGSLRRGSELVPIIRLGGGSHFF